MIEVHELSKTYGGSQWAVRDVSFSVARGEVVGFLGPNGAGKSTTLRIVAGFLGATSGRVRVAGHDIVEQPMKARAAMGYMPEAVPLYPELRVEEYLRYRAELKGVARSARRSAVGRAMELARVADHASYPIGHLSKGYRQRVGLADALVASPPILILDEPTAGLDPNQIREVRDLVRELGRDHAVMLSTHILPEVEASCDRAVVIAKGRLVASGKLDELSRLRRARALRVVVDAPSLDAARALLAGLGDVGEVRREGDALTVTWKASVDDTAAAVEPLARALVAAGIGLREVSPVRASLEEVFVELTRGAAAGAPDAEATP